MDYGLTLVKGMEHKLKQMDLYPKSDGKKTAFPSLAMLEKTLFDICSTQNVVKGVFYILPVYHQGKLFLRYEIFI